MRIYKVETMSKTSSPDAIIILGKKLKDDGSPSDELVERIKKAIEIRKKSSCYFIVSGGFRNKKSHVSEAKVMKDQLVDRGVERDKIKMEEKSKDLVGNAFFSLKICQKTSWNDITIVTASYNKARVEYVFKKVFGSRYNLEFGFVKIYSKLKLVSEFSLLILTKLFLGTIPAGKDEKIREFLQRCHPFYSDIIFS